MGNENLDTTDLGTEDVDKKDNVDKKRMTRSVEYELHSALAAQPQFDEHDQLPGYVGEEGEQHEVLRLTFDADDDALIWVGVNTNDTLSVVDDEAESVAGFAVVQRRLGPAFGIIPRSPDVLINGVRVLGFHVLTPRDSLVLAPGILTYMTERFIPYVGPARHEHIGQRCPYCKIKINDQTHVVTCRCGCVYHHETQESHPRLKEDDRLNCYEKVRACLSCTRPLTLDSVLVWDPAEIQ